MFPQDTPCENFWFSYLYCLSIQPSSSLELLGALYQLLKCPPEFVCKTNCKRLYYKVKESHQIKWKDYLTWFRHPLQLHYYLLLSSSSVNPTARLVHCTVIYAALVILGVLLLRWSCVERHFIRLTECLWSSCPRSAIYVFGDGVLQSRYC